MKSTTLVLTFSIAFYSLNKRKPVVGDVGDVGACDNDELNKNLLRNQNSHHKWCAKYQEIIRAVQTYEYGIIQYALVICSRMKLQRQIIYNRIY